jgi:succinate dehydrogenase / fumarate reductase flavoprotein subunit
MLDFVKTAPLLPLPRDPDFMARAEVDRLVSRPRGENVAEIRSAMQEVMMDKVSVVRNEESLREAQGRVDELRRAYMSAAVQDKGAVYNTELTEALELGYMLDCAETIVAGALARTESRGGHYRSDYEARDDKEWLAHTMVRRTSGGLTLAKKPVTITQFEPKERKY